LAPCLFLPVDTTETLSKSELAKKTAAGLSFIQPINSICLQSTANQWTGARTFDQESVLSKVSANPISLQRHLHDPSDKQFDKLYNDTSI